MPWNWQLARWPQFQFSPESIAQKEKEFLLAMGSSAAFLKNMKTDSFHYFVVEILSSEGWESSKIEGEVLDRSSLQSSIRKHFGLAPGQKKETKKEAAMAKLLTDVYETYHLPLSHAKLWYWHQLLFDDGSLSDHGQYRTHPEPMQIVSNRYGNTHVFFEAPPSSLVQKEMEGFIHWFNGPSLSLPLLARAAIAHLYFENIHPFEDGNGRIGRLLIEKVLSQGVGRPVLMAVSKTLEKRKKNYYSELEKCNRSLNAQDFVVFFADVILDAQKDAMALIHFLMKKTQILTMLGSELNPRQEKVLLCLFAEGPSGFKGGLSSENYVAITKTSKATATRDLNDLVQKGALTKTGTLRHTRYWLNLTN